MAEELTQEQKEKAAKLETLNTELKAKNDALGSNKGLRHFAGSTRGKGSMIIQYQGFDTDKPETLPTTMAEFAELLGITKPEEILEYAIEGANAVLYRTASDPIAEFVNQSWDKDTQIQFRTVVRNMVKMSGMSIEAVVEMVKPGVEKKFAASKA